jgi:hypothetical protein
MESKNIILIKTESKMIAARGWEQQERRRNRADLFHR